MERAQPQPFHRPAEDRAYSLAHLAGGLVGEGNRKHLVRVGPPGQQDMSEAGGEHARLADARTSPNEEWTVHCLDRFSLFCIEACDVIDHTTSM